VDIVVARTGDVEKKALRAFSVIALFLIPLTGIAAALAGWSVANRLLKPLNRLVAASREIGIAALDRRVDEPEHPAELRELAQAYNGMLGRLQRAVEALRRFTADASHELRTPLTAIRGTAEVALARPRSPEELRETMGEILDETRSMLAPGGGPPDAGARRGSGSHAAPRVEGGSGGRAPRRAGHRRGACRGEGSRGDARRAGIGVGARRLGAAPAPLPEPGVQRREVHGSGDDPHRGHLRAPP
jgi:HAMP domain-containing protein